MVLRGRFLLLFAFANVLRSIALSRPDRLCRWDVFEEKPVQCKVKLEAFLEDCSNPGKFFLMGDSNVARLYMSSFLFYHRAFENSCKTIVGGRCNLLDLIDSPKVESWKQPRAGLEGPAKFGAQHPFCTDCSGCNPFLVDCKSADKSESATTPVVSYLPLEYSRDVEAQSRDHNTTVENIAAYLETENVDVCVYNAAVHDVNVPGITDKVYVENIEFSVRELLKGCQKLVWMSTPAVDERFNRGGRWLQNNTIIKRWNGLVESMILKVFPERVFVLDTFLWSVGQRHPQDHVHARDFFYKTLGIFLLAPTFLKGAAFDGPFAGDEELLGMYEKGIIRWKPTTAEVPCFSPFAKEVFGLQFPMGGGGKICVDMSALPKNVSLRCSVVGSAPWKSYVSGDGNRFYCQVPASRQQLVQKVRIETVSTRTGSISVSSTYTILVRSFEFDFDKLNLCSGKNVILSEGWMNFDLFTNMDENIKRDWGHPDNLNRDPFQTVMWNALDGLGFVSTHSIKRIVISHALNYLSPSNLQMLAEEMARVLVPGTGILRIQQASNVKFRRIVFEVFAALNVHLVDVGSFRTRTADPEVLSVLQPECLKCVHYVLSMQTEGLFETWQNITHECWICHIDRSWIRDLGDQSNKELDIHSAGYHVDEILSQRKVLVYGTDVHFQWVLEGGVGGSLADIDFFRPINVLQIWPYTDLSIVSSLVRELKNSPSWPDKEEVIWTFHAEEEYK
jgi:hypothetical protein